MDSGCESYRRFREEGDQEALAEIIRVYRDGLIFYLNSLVGDFGEALKKVISEFSPDRIIIEPSGVGKLSDVLGAVKKIDNDDNLVNGLVQDVAVYHRA